MLANLNKMVLTVFERPLGGWLIVLIFLRFTYMTDTANRVKKIVAEHLGVEESKVTETASFIDDLGADSLDTVELVMAFEEEFGCEIPDEAAEKILTVKDAIDYLSKNA